MINSKPKLLFLLPLPPPIHGAAAVSESIRQSQRINETFDCDYINISLSRANTEIGSASINKVWRYMGVLFKTFHTLLHNKYDLCCIALTCHGKGFLKDAPLALLCKLFGVKLMIHQHNKGMKADSGKWLYHHLLEAVYKNAMVVLLSWRLYDDISAIVSRDQVMICHNGIPESGEIVQKGQPRNDTVNLLFLSNLIPSKGLYDLLEACTLLKEKGIRYECHIVGNETEECSGIELTSAIRNLGLDDYVSYDGSKSGEEKSNAFDSSDIFVFPTRYPNECFPLVLLEALQHSLPIVTTDEGGIPDIVKDGTNGIICSHDLPASMADAIEKLSADEQLRKRMGETGRALYETEFTSDIFIDTLITCISRSLIG